MPELAGPQDGTPVRPPYRVRSQTAPRMIQSAAIHTRHTGKARTTQIGARSEPSRTPSVATTTARAIAAADSQAAFRHQPRIVRSAAI